MRRIHFMIGASPFSSSWNPCSTRELTVVPPLPALDAFNADRHVAVSQRCSGSRNFELSNPDRSRLRPYRVILSWSG